MLDNPQEALDFGQAEAPDQTHLGWRTMSADAGDGQDRLLLSEPSQPLSEPLVQFLDHDTEEQAGQPALQLESGSVHDSAFEAPSFLWGGSEQCDTTASNHQPLAEPCQPLVVFADSTNTNTASATVFS